MPPIPITSACSTVKLTKKVMIKPFATIHMMGLCKVPFTAKGVDVMVEAGEEPFYTLWPLLIAIHISDLGSNQAPLGIWNHNCRMVTIPPKTVVARVTATDEVLPGPGPQVNKGEDTEMEWSPVEPGNLNQLFENIDISGITKWSSEEQQEFKNLIIEYYSLFALDDLDLRYTSVVKHYSPWASVVVLVRKKMVACASVSSCANWMYAPWKTLITCPILMRCWIVWMGPEFYISQSQEWILAGQVGWS